MSSTKSYLSLPQNFFHKQSFKGFENAKELLFNEALSQDMKLNNGNNYWTNIITQGQATNSLFAQAYAGHQFGHFTMLGDGRALMLEESQCNGELFDLQLKGSGATPFSRRGDGKATLKAMLREYIISEAMHALGIPSSRSLGIYATGENVYREQVEEGAALIRIASSHIRVGTFEYAGRFGSKSDLEQLTNYTIDRHYPELKTASNKPLELIRSLMQKQIKLVVEWMRVGFIHGVMNTDNVGLAGETFDYGPCAFMNNFSLDTVFSSIDKGSRYCFGNQPYITQWNLVKFAETLLPLINNDVSKAAESAQMVINEFKDLFQQAWYDMMYRKLGLVEYKKGDKELVDEVYKFLEQYKPDYTNFFNGLLYKKDSFKGEWVHEAEYSDIYDKWKDRTSNHEEESNSLMKENNPYVIPRNHKIEEALDAGKKGEMEIFVQILKEVSNPYQERKLDASYIAAPNGFDSTYQTFCGT